MFEGLSDRLQKVLGKAGRKGKLSKSDIESVLREIRIALLEADVNLQVVKEFIDEVRAELIGKEISEALTPSQQVIKSVHDKLVELLGGEHEPIRFSPTPPTVIMLVGLQGSGKTTTAAKLARLLKAQGRHPMLVAADVYRPAAVEQLKTLGREIDVPVFSAQKDPVSIAADAYSAAKELGVDTLILDTAGRLHIDEEMMAELERIRDTVKPHEILLVVDAMTGQEAVNVAKTFDERIGITGVIMTKMEGDARGGAALSVKKVTGKPIKYVGVGEKLDALEPFHPDRVASRILGMGDVLSLIEKAQKAFDEKQALEMEKRLMEGEFTLEDMREQLRALRNMGSLESIIDMLPGFGGMKSMLKNARINEKEIAHMEAVINSMTREERLNPSIINSSRKRRIARGSGTSVQMVNRVLKQYQQMRKMMKGLKKGKKKKKKLKGLPFGGMDIDFMNMFK
ncbi:MAG: signal recognition particle protein [Deferribacteres bacterium]|nr:signal recognition particle protein [Deferribacteres bacterium]